MRAVMPPNQPMRAVLFDVFGTLLDVYSVQAAADRLFPGFGQRLALLWRDKQIEYSRVRTLSSRYAPFIQVTRDALDFSLAALAIQHSSAQLDALLGEYDRLRPFDDVAPALARLRDRNVVLGVLSNGDPLLLQSSLGNAGLLTQLTHVLSADLVRQFKTADAVYALGPQTLGLPAAEILFVSSNGWDAIGAAWYGYTSFWVNRGGVPLDRLGQSPHGSGASLESAVDFFMQQSH